MDILIWICGIIICFENQIEVKQYIYYYFISFWTVVFFPVLLRFFNLERQYKINVGKSFTYSDDKIRQ